MAKRCSTAADMFTRSSPNEPTFLAWLEAAEVVVVVAAALLAAVAVVEAMVAVEATVEVTEAVAILQERVIGAALEAEEAVVAMLLTELT